MRHENAELHNVVELIPAEDGIGQYMLRVPDSLRPTLNEAARNNAPYPAGCEIRFNLRPGETAKVVLATDVDNVLPPVAEVCQGCFRTQVVLVGMEPTELTITALAADNSLEPITAEHKLPFDARLTRVLLPQLHRTKLLGIEGAMTPPRPGQTPSETILAYGSSITHGAHSVRPGGTYAMQTARHLGVDLLDLGFGGGAHMEATLAEHIASRDDWDLATLEMGINVGGWSTDEFHGKVERFVDIISSAHPDKWIFCIDLFTFAGDLMPDHPGHVRFRESVAAIVEKLDRPKLVHVDGRDILQDVRGLTFDLVHPSDDGFIEMGRRLAERIRTTMQVQGDRDTRT
ncbi:MAG: SGNH/GDSL hydrolase family protein [Planctomycetota bacterium]